MLNTVYFDLGNVLVFVNQTKMFSQIADCCGLSLEETKRLVLDHHIQEAYETGKIDSVAVFHYLKSRSPKSFTLHELMTAFSDIFEPNEALWPTVEKLKSEGMRLVIISNTCECHYNRIYSHYPILRLFDHKILSFEVGAMKPSPQIFQKALSLAKGASFFTDDIPSYVSGARQAGLDSELFTDVSSLRKHLIRRGCNFLA